MTTPGTPRPDLRLPPPSSWERSKPKVYAILLLVVIFGLVTLAGLAYSHAFESSIPVHLKADRAGLQMHEGNRVKFNGVDLGRVTDVTLDPSGTEVDIELSLKPKLAESLPANTTVTLEQLTAFGNKAVQMHLPADPSRENLAAGAVIQVEHVTTEINSTFDELMTLINEVQPAKLNAVLGAFAGTFGGNGDTLGTTITQANAYLKRINPDLTPLKRDWGSVGGFSDVYAGAGNSIADTIRNAGTISDSFQDERDDFEQVLTQFGNTGDEVNDFFGQNATPLREMLKSLRPFTSLLDEYSPAMTCFLDGAAVNYDRMQAKGWRAAGANFEVNMVSPGGTEQYHYPQDLPQIGPGPERGPNCRGLPLTEPNEDSLADYTTGPQSLNQGTEDNSPRPVTNPQQITPGPLPFYNASSSNDLTSMQAAWRRQWLTMTPVQKFFGPEVQVPFRLPVARGVASQRPVVDPKAGTRARGLPSELPVIGGGN